MMEVAHHHHHLCLFLFLIVFSLSRLLPFQAPVLPLVLSMYVCVFVLFTTIPATTRTINDYHDNDDGASNLLAN